jgi:serine protease
MATPHAAGVAALVVGEGITDPDKVEQILKQTARKPTNQKYDAEHYGAGIIDAPAAIKKARSQSGGGGGTLVLGLLMAGAAVASARARGLGVKVGWTYLGGVVVGASGLFFLPYIAPELSSAPVISTLTHGLPSWDMSILGPTSHGSALFFSALVPLALLVIGYGSPRLRAPLAGLAIGVAAHLIYFAVVPTAAVQAPIVGIAAVWLALNALACILIARLALRR